MKGSHLAFYPLCPPAMAKAHLKVEPATRDRLRAEKVGGETYDDVLNRLLESSDSRGGG